MTDPVTPALSDQLTQRITDATEAARSNRRILLGTHPPDYQVIVSDVVATLLAEGALIDPSRLGKVGTVGALIATATWSENRDEPVYMLLPTEGHTYAASDAPRRASDLLPSERYAGERFGLPDPWED